MVGLIKIMKEQTIVTEKDRYKFELECKKLLTAGWHVIPGTVFIATAMAATNHGSTTGYMSAREFSSSEFVAFFEKS